jgi:hypothetical protein
MSAGPARTGCPWHEIGGVLSFGPLATASAVHVSDHAFDYCVGLPSESP